MLLLLPVVAPSAERWKMQFFYDKADSSLDIRDIQCPSATHCIATGVIDEKRGHSKNTVLLTTDGGKQWSLVDVKEEPVSLFFLNESRGWMVSARGVWTTGDGGRNWKKLEGLKKGLLEVYFLSPSHGYAIGFPSAVYETSDGGAKWTKLAAADQPGVTPPETVYECITFLGPHGFIVGNSAGAEQEDTPIWMNLSEAPLRRERPSTLVVLETGDGGAHWESYTSSFYGRLTQLQVANDGFALALFRYRDYYSLPSRVYKVKFRTSLETIFGERDRAVTDVALLPEGGAILSAVEPPGPSNQVPIPGKLKMLKSNNLKVWEEMDVDYRAVAGRAILAVQDAQHMWVATDTGMILTLVNEGSAAR